MIKGIMNFENKSKNNNYTNIARPKTETHKKIILDNKQNINNKNNNVNIMQKSNINQPINNNMQIKNNNNINSQKNKIPKMTGKIQKIKKIAQNFGNNNKNMNNEYNHNKIEGLNKQYTPILKNENDIFQFYNFNIKSNCIKNINAKEDKNSIAENPNFHKRAKSSNKPFIIIEQIKNKKVNIKLNDNYKSNGKNYPHLINKKKKDNIKQKENSPKQKNNNIHVVNISPNKKNFPFINTNINKIQIKDDKKIEIKNIFNDNFNDKNIQISKDNKNINRQINIRTPPYVSYAMYDHPNSDYRKEMEDFHNFKNLSFPNIIFTYFSIFDGHGGVQVSSFLKDNFHIYLTEELKLISLSNNTELNNKKIITSINIAFEKIDKVIIENKSFKNEMGSTGTIILLYRDPNNPYQRFIICANVGDSKGYIINKKNVKKITTDHICSDSSEVNRIRNTGGAVFSGRVFGVLMLTRSFGDKEFKQCGVLATPSIFISSIENNDLYAVIASDGVWDMITEENLFELSKEKMSSEEFSKKIVITSLEKGTQDNISCFVIKLNSI